ncbi:membrane protein insertion efficiency factor YidD [Candidatus Arcticimaribacter forsetii]|uniref:membrane protein insertion efficiency factor YidD n=1 Tax=Candidatus Arcticimaribacter forsetii TaxID=2820661 RepID=UPI0030136F62
MKSVLIKFIRFYQKNISPFKPYSSCIFNPTCSEYFIQSLVKYGLYNGTKLGLKRIFRCRHGSRGGYDPV